MKLFVPLTLLAGVLVAGCASDNSNFSSVPGPSGGTPTASSETQPAPAPVQTHPSTPQPAPAPQAVQSQQSATEQVQMTQSTPPQSQSPVSKPSQAIVTPDNSASGKVVTYNSVGRFVVLRFSSGKMPSNGQTLFSYRGGLKVGELKISGEQRDDYIVADIVNGDAQPGDDAREQ